MSAPPKPVSKTTAKAVGVINPRLVDYTCSIPIALLIGLAMLGTFIGVLIVNQECVYNVRVEQKTDTNHGNWLLQKLHIEGIHAPPREEEKGVTREVDMCMVTAFYEQTLQVSDAAGLNPIESQYRYCILPPDDVLRDLAWPEFLTWCELEALEDTWREVLDETCGKSPYECYADGLANDFPGWLCIYKDLNIANAGFYGDQCEDWDLSRTYRWCGQTTSTETFRWDSWDSPMTGISTPFTLVLSYKITETTEVCPSFTNAFGAAMGFVGLAELVATLVLGGFFIVTGIARPVTPQASFFNLLKGAGIASISSDAMPMGELKKAVTEANLPVPAASVVPPASVGQPDPSAPKQDV